MLVICLGVSMGTLLRSCWWCSYTRVYMLCGLAPYQSPGSCAWIQPGKPHEWLSRVIPIKEKKYEPENGREEKKIQIEKSSFRPPTPRSAPQRWSRLQHPDYSLLWKRLLLSYWVIWSSIVYLKNLVSIFYGECRFAVILDLFCFVSIHYEWVDGMVCVVCLTGVQS